MSLLLSQLTPVVDTGPIGTGVNCLEYEVYVDFFESDENSWFFILEDGETGPIGTGISCIEFETYQEDGTVDESSVFFISEEVPIISAVFLRPIRVYYAT